MTSEQRGFQDRERHTLRGVPDGRPTRPTQWRQRRESHKQGHGDPLETSRKTDGGLWSEPQVRPVGSGAFCVRHWNATAGEDGGMGQILGGMMAEDPRNLVKAINLLVSDAADQSGQS